MPYKYTGLASELRIPGDSKVYKPGDIVPISKQDALNLTNQGSLHSFEIVANGNDLLDAETTPQGSKK